VVHGQDDETLKRRFSEGDVILAARLEAMFGAG
jgi:hypothetical protein